MKLAIQSTINTISPLYSLFQDNKYIFIVGRNICFKEFGLQNYSYMPIYEQTEEIMALNVSHNRRSVITVQRINKNDIFLCVYQISNGQRKSIKITNKTVYKVILEPGVIQSAFLNIVLIYTSQQSNLLWLDTNRMKIIANAYIGESISSIKTHPSFNNIVCAFSNDTIRVYEIKDGGYQLQYQPSKKLSNIIKFVAVTWFDNNTLLICSRQDIFVLSVNNNSHTTQQLNQQIIQKISIKFQDHQFLTNIAHFGNFFVVSTNRGKISIYLKSRNGGILFSQIQKVCLQDPIYIQDLKINNSQELIILRSKNFEYYVGKLGKYQQQEQFRFKQPLSITLTDYMVGYVQYQGVSICETKSLGLFIISKLDTLIIWNFTTNRCILKKKIISKSKQDRTNILRAGTIHPLGYSLVLALQDRIKFCHLMVDDIRVYHQLPYKKVRGIKYSQGGHLLSFYYGSGKNSTIVILNAVTMVQISVLKTYIQIHHFLWSKNDTDFIVGCECYLFIWKARDNFRNKIQISLPPNLNNVRYDSNTQYILVSTDNMILWIYDGKIIQNRKIPINDFDFIFPFNNQYILTDKRGNIHLTNSLQFQKFESLSICNGRGHLFFKGQTLLFLADKNCQMSIIRTKIVQRNQSDNNKYKEYILGQEDPEELVLISKGQINRNRQKLKYLQNAADILQADLSGKLENERHKYGQLKKQNEQRLKKELDFSNSNYLRMLEQKQQIQKKSDKLFEDIEINQIKAVEEIQHIYQYKMMLQRNKLIDCEQQLNKGNYIYQKKLRQLQKKHDQQILQIRKDYQNKFKRFFINQKNDKQLRTYKIKQSQQIKLAIQSQNQQIYLNLQLQTQRKIKQLHLKFASSQQKNNKLTLEYQKNLQKLIQIQKKLQNKDKIIQQINKNLTQSNNKAISLQNQAKQKNLFIKQQQTRIRRLQDRIADLQKSKTVLGFKTTQIWKQLQPKANQIQKLKDQLFRLEAEYKHICAQNLNFSQKLENSDKKINHLKFQLFEIVNKLKQTQTIYKRLQQQIYRIVKQVHTKFWNSQLIRVYQNFVQKYQNGLMTVRQKKNKNLAQDNQEDLTQQLNRHLIHLQQSLFQVGVSNERILKGKQKQVQKRYRENAQLISELNQMRKKQKHYKNELIIKNNQILHLKKHLKDIQIPSSIKYQNNNILKKRLSSAFTGVSTKNKTSRYLIQSAANLVDQSFRLDQNISQNQVNRQDNLEIKRNTSTSNKNNTNQLKINYNINHSMTHRNNRRKTYMSGAKLKESYDANTGLSVLLELERAESKIKQQQKIIQELNRKDLS